MPAVSFVDPRYTILDDGTGNDDHPHADIRDGDLFLYRTFKAVAHGPKWANTVLSVNFDERGGFFDLVVPPRATAANNVDNDLMNGKALLGLRVPTVVASPFSRGNLADPRVSALVFDHTSVLKLIEWRWGLAPLTRRDASTDVNNLAYALNFRQPDATVPSLPEPRVPLGNRNRPSLVHLQSFFHDEVNSPLSLGIVDCVKRSHDGEDTKACKPRVIISQWVTRRKSAR